jgi:hypothetical protein
MTRPDRDWPPKREAFEQDLDPDLGGAEREELLALAVRLSEQRPVPRPGMRSAVRAGLLGERPPRSRAVALVFGYATSGALLLAVAAVGLAGLGPFAA